jgi:hypothetical protein
MECDVSLDSVPFSPFHAASDTSPNKSLPDDVRNAMSEMLKESSGICIGRQIWKSLLTLVDYCRKFEKLTRMHQDISPAKELREESAPIL